MVRKTAPVAAFDPRRELRNLSWSDLQLFLQCTEHKSLRLAARQLGITPSTVIRRVARLEHQLGQCLFHRVRDGVSLTEAGAQVAEQCLLMQEALIRFTRKATLSEHTRRGSVTLAVTEGLGTYWVTPHLVTFQRENPHINVNLICAMGSVDVLRLEADFAIQFTRPHAADLLTQKLGRLHLYPFASPGYLEIYGTPASLDDLQNHRFVQQVGPELDNGAFATYFRLGNPSEQVALKTNTSSAHLYAIENGAGIGGLPNFAAALGAPVVPIDVGMGYGMDIWLTAHADSRKLPHKSLFLDWIKTLFDTKKYPWFGSEFIHPWKLSNWNRLPVGLEQSGRFLGANPQVPMRAATSQ